MEKSWSDLPGISAIDPKRTLTWPLARGLLCRDIQRRRTSMLPIYSNSFLLFFIAGWIIRTIILPYLIARRVGRKFNYGYIGLNDRATLTMGEQNLLKAQKLLAIAGLIAFGLTVVLLFRLPAK
jgi:hypothetical protein